MSFGVSAACARGEVVITTAYIPVTNRKSRRCMNAPVMRGAMYRTDRRMAPSDVGPALQGVDDVLAGIVLGDALRQLLVDRAQAGCNGWRIDFVAWIIVGSRRIRETPMIG